MAIFSDCLDSTMVFFDSKMAHTDPGPIPGGTGTGSFRSKIQGI